MLLSFPWRGSTSQDEVAIDELGPVLDRMRAGSRRSNRAIVSELSALRIDIGSLRRATELVCELMTKQPLSYGRLELGPSAWRDRIERDEAPGPIGGSWFRAFDATLQCIFELYEEDFGSTRATLERLTLVEPRVPFLSLLIATALEELDALPLEALRNRRRLSRAVRGLFDERQRLARWLDEKEARGIRPREIGGMTFTVVGMYDWVVHSPATGCLRFPKTAEACIDLGGGYATPDLRRVLGLPLVSFDLEPPTRARELGIRRFAATTAGKKFRAPPQNRIRWQTDAEAELYFAQLEQQPWQRFDVYGDRFDASADSYFVTSFGFMTSTVASHSPLALTRRELSSNVRAQMATTFTAASRVMELVLAGKDVSLLTYQRAISRAYRNITVFLRFKAHALVDFAAFEEPFQHEGFQLVPPVGKKLR